MILFELEEELFSKWACRYIVNLVDIYEADINEDSTEENELIRFFPRLTFIENKKECLTTFYKLREWARDKIYHKLGSLEKYCILKMFEDIDEICDDYGHKFFINAYLNEDIRNVIKEIKTHFAEELEDEERINNKELVSLYISSEGFIIRLFDDVDEEFIDLFVSGKNENVGFIDEYFYDVLPKDIVERIKKDKEERDNDIGFFLHMFKEIFEKSIYRLYGVEKYKEKDFQLLFELFSRSFNCASLDVKKVIRETTIGDGVTDFIINFPVEKNVVFEIKMDEKSKVKKSIEHQIPEYLKRLENKKAVIIIFSKNNKNEKYYYDVAKNINEKRNVHIAPIIIDYSKKATPSKAG